jgi:hypothetical protein
MTLKSGYLQGALKVVIINRDLCVAFAGKVGFAENAIENISAKNYTVDRLAKYLLKVHEESERQTDFIIASLMPMALYKIAKGTISDSEKSYWIGDIDAFEAFQKYSYNANINTDNDFDSDTLLIAKTALAMMRVILDSTIHSVDELLIYASSTEEGFVYHHNGTMGSERQQTISSPGWHTIKMGGVAEGGFGYVVLIPALPGIGAIGAHFFQGRVGVLFYPVKERTPVVISNVSRDEFVVTVKEKYDILLLGGTIT